MREWVFPYLKQYRRRMSLSLILGILGIGSGAMLLFVSGYLISKSSLQPANIMVVYVPVVAVRAFSIGQAVFLYSEKLVSHDLVLRTLENMRIKLYQIVEPQALFLRSRYQTGDLLGVLSDDIEHLQDLYLRTIFPSLIGLAIYTIIVILFGAFHLVFGIIIALFVGLIVFVIPYFSFTFTSNSYLKQKETQRNLYSNLTDAIFGMTDWKASGLEGEFLQEMEGYEENKKVIDRQINRSKHIRDALIQLVIGLAVIAVMIWANIQAELDIFSPTVIAAFVLMMFAIGDALLLIPEAIQPITLYDDSIKRIKQVENEDLPRIYRGRKPTKDMDNPTIELQTVT